MGKAFIARVLLWCEDFLEVQGGWYQELFNQLISMGEELRDGQLSIITFNYDRTLELFLHRCFMALDPSHDSGASWAWVRRIRIVHVYGSLGDPMSAIGTPKTFGLVQKSAQKITLARKDHRSTAKDLIEDIFELAERCVFIGFGFDPLNLDALGIPAEGGIKPHWIEKLHADPFVAGPKSEIFASCAGLSASARAHAEARLGKVNWGGPMHRALEFLHSFPLFS